MRVGFVSAALVHTRKLEALERRMRHASVISLILVYLFTFISFCSLLARRALNTLTVNRQMLGPEN